MLHDDVMEAGAHRLHIDAASLPNGVYIVRVTGEHGVGVEKLHLMPYQFDEPTMQQFQRVKAAFDPNNILNPGKKVGGTFADLERSLIQGVC